MLDHQTLVATERNRSGQRRLDAELHEVDNRLTQWAAWAKDKYTELGYPTRSVTEKANEGGILAREACPVHAPEWPEDVVEIEQLVAALTTRHLAAVMATYFHQSLPREVRAGVFASYLRWLNRTRRRDDPRSGRRSRDLSPSRDLGEGAYTRDLDRARWVIRYGLERLTIE